MLKRSFTFIAMLVLLVMTTLVQAQPEPVLVLTEAAINDGFTLPSTATRTISNIVVDVKPGEVHVSFDLTYIQDGTSNTLSIIAILIGLVQVEGHTSSPVHMRFTIDDVQISGLTAPPNAEREVSQMVMRAWRNYIRNSVGGVDVSDMIEVVALMEEEGIHFFVKDSGR